MWDTGGMSYVPEVRVTQPEKNNGITILGDSVLMENLNPSHPPHNILLAFLLSADHVIGMVEMN